MLRQNSMWFGIWCNAGVVSLKVMYLPGRCPGQHCAVNLDLSVTQICPKKP